MNKNSYKCQVCGKNYAITISNAGYPGEKERENIDCPWCGAENGTEVTNGFITTHKVLTKGGASK